MTDLATRPGGSTPDVPQPVRGPRGRLGRLSYRRRGRTVFAWVAALAVAVVLSVFFGGDFAADYSAPGSDSKAAQQLLQERFPSQSGATVTVVIRADGGVASVQSDVRTLLAALDAAPHVAGVDDPFQAPGGIAPDGRTAVASLRLDVVNPDDMPVADSQQLIDIAHGASRSGMTVALGGQSIQRAEQGAIGSEGIGLIAAIIILLLTFRSVIAAGPPLAVALPRLPARRRL